jgi:YVTN family beta-propeller protein
MRFRQSLAAAVAVAAGVATPIGLSAPTVQAATTAVPLPIAQYSHMLIDPVHQHLFITSGSGSSSILVTDYAGQTVATIPNEPGATGLALSSDGNTVYAALAGGDAVSAIDTSTLAETARYSTGTGTDPTYIAYTSGRIWFGYGAAARGGLGSIDPSTSPAFVNIMWRPDADPSHIWPVRLRFRRSTR